MGILDLTKQEGAQLSTKPTEITDTNASIVAVAQSSMVTSSPIAVRKKRDVPARKWYAEARKWDNIKCRKSGGSRKTRREENANFLLDVGGEPDLSDFVELTESCGSSFSELFMEQEKMRLWNDFINWSEDEQERLLLAADQSGRSAWRCHDDSDGAGDESLEVIEYVREGSGDSFQLIDDNRTVHPAFSGEECFKRLHPNLKALLNKRHLPLGKLVSIEKEITEFFCDWPTSIYVSQRSDSYERLLLHCLCRYHDLSSHSFDTNDGLRQTEVENKHSTFLPPDVSLTEYLETKRQ